MTKDEQFMINDKQKKIKNKRSHDCSYTVCQLTCSKEKGFTLIETLVGAVILATVILGPVTFLATSFTKVDASEDRLSALYLAQEGLELTRRVRDNNILAGNNWNQGLTDGNYEIDYNSPLTSYAGLSLRYDATNGLYSYDSGATTKYTRKITIANIAADQMRITSHMDWVDKSGAKSAELQEVLYNWQ